MFDKLKMKFAARRVNNTRRRPTARNTNARRAHTRRPSFWGRVWNIICAPFRAFWRLCKRVWNWVCGIDLVGLLNLTLLIVIIVLFSMLIMDVLRCRRAPVVVVSDAAPVAASTVVPANKEPIKLKTRTTITRDTVKLPIKRNPVTRQFESKPLNIVPTKKEPVVERQTARIDETIFGDVIIDSRDAGATVFRDRTRVKGNVYIQRMHKYILPCGLYIDGNLFLRDMGMLQFCGEFTVTGNIYVTPRSSFGPLPANARIGGQIIL